MSRLQSIDFFFGKSSNVSYVTDWHPFLLQIPGNVCTAFFPAFRYPFIHHRSHCAVIVPVFLLAFIVPTALSLVILGYLCLLEQLLEYTILQGLRPLHQTAKIAKHKHPFVEHTLQFVLSFSELRHFEINKGELVVKDVMLSLSLYR